MRVIIYITILVLAALAAPVAQAEARLQVTAGIPEGFETLEAPRPTSVTLYYGGDVLGNFAAHFTPSSLAFDDPEAVLKALPAIDDPAAIGSVLASPMATHAELVCGAKPVEGCGKLDPKVAGIVFDENHLSAELFIQRRYLPVTDQDSARYLPLPERRFSSVYRLDGAVSGSGEERPSFSLSDNSVYAFGEGNLATQSTLSNQGLRFDTVSANVERMGWSASAGLMRSLPMQLAADSDIAGVSLSTSMRTRLDEHKTEGNEVIVYLPRRAFVSIYRDGRLFSSRSYEAGNQRIDTTELPEGAYTITLKIQEADGAAREEKRFFAKSSEIPPPDAPTYYLQGGVLRKPPSEDSTLPQLTQSPLVRAGMVRRIDDNIGLNVAAAGLSDRAAMETGAFMVTPAMQLRATVLASTRNDVGVQATVLYMSDRWSAALDARRLWVRDAVPLDYQGLLSDITQATGNVSYMPVPSLTLSLRGSYSASKGAPSATSFGPAADWRIWQEGESALHFTADAGRVDGRNAATAIMQFSYRMGQYGFTGESGAGYGGSEHGGFGSARVSRDATTADQSLLLGAGVHSDARLRSISGDGDWRNSFGRVQGSVQQALGTNGSTTTYGGNFALGAAQAQELVHIGGNEADMSAIIVEVAGDADAAMTIFVNGTPHGVVQVGHRQVLYLTPYTIYRVRVAPQKEGLFSLDGGEHKVALYPGNVVRLTWQVNAFSVVTARIVTPAGTPLADAALQESQAGVATDAKGRFQAELAHPRQLTFTGSDGARCQVTLPEKRTAVNGVLLFGDLVCQP